MRVWAKTLKDHKIQTDVVQEFALARPSDLYGWTPVIDDLCHALDIERPVILNKHIQDLCTFNRVIFRPSDFMDSVGFDRFEIEIFPEKKKNDWIDAITY
ncbi:MAG: hypothetical protein Q4A88_05330 [Clostridia bacterium]|nr:hypothetical protein [Clostridia bacterium]